MITAENYYGLISKVNIAELPPAIAKGYEYVDKVTHNGGDWNAYHSSETIKKVIDLYFTKVETYIPTASPKKETPAPVCR